MADVELGVEAAIAGEVDVVDLQTSHKPTSGGTAGFGGPRTITAIQFPSSHSFKLPVIQAQSRYWVLIAL
jgi:hypothetical protein